MSHSLPFAPPAGVTFRHGTDADLPAILDLWVAAWAATMPEIDFATRRNWLTERQRSMVSEGAIILLASCAGELVGYALVNPLTAYLDQIAVAPSQHGQGIAPQLLAQAQRLSPTKLTLHVNQKNGRAIRFYEREGFVRTGEGTNPRSGLPIFFYTWTAPV
jgi:putative acetyltransferase